MSTAKKLPKGLPALPPVPEGWDAWEYMGIDWWPSGPVGSPYGACAGDRDNNWYERPSAEELGKATSTLVQGHGCHIIRAIKRPAAKKAGRVCQCSMRTRTLGDGCDVCNPSLAAELAAENAAEAKPAKKAKGKRVVARVGMMTEAGVRTAQFVLPADAASVERMVLQAAVAIAKMPRRSCNDELARAALAAIGLIRAKRAEKGTG